ncbi:MAG: hypothetical protein KBS83_01775 [Lachnospiraceae bacterium]|nr:hypothetical protein [Candidatus Equihabitans merdae]
MGMIMKSTEAADQIKPSVETRMINWPECFYEEAELDDRKALLDEADRQNLTPEENAIRRKILDMRYVVQKKSDVQTDRFLQLWLYLTYAVNNSKRGAITKRQAKEVKKLADSIGLDTIKGEIAEKALYKEFYHTAVLYTNLSMADKQYGSFLFGLGRLKGDKLSLKIANDFFKACYAGPSQIDFAHHDLWSEALTNAFGDFFPAHSSYLAALIEKSKTQ